MKRAVILLLILQLFTAMQCGDDDECGFSDFTGYNLMVENPQLSYSINDTIWINSSASSKQLSYCSTNDSVINYNRFDFKESFFPLKLKNAGTINAENSLNDFEYFIDTGFNYYPNFCHNSYYIIPILSNNESEYKFRVGFIPKKVGNYAIATGFGYPFDANLDLNLEIFEPYNNFDDILNFENCGDTFSRYNADRNNYFFKVE